jgi:tRNA dimethylallyltransferase
VARLEPPLTVIVGPTASGKTALAVRLAEERGGEIVSADSVQIYRRFELGSGKPSAEERARAVHHLIDELEPLDAVDAARWAELAAQKLEDIRARGRVPIVCGGSFLWVRALLYGLAPAPPADAAVRERHRAWAEREGRGALHAELARIDPESASRLAPNDYVRVSRALEVHELTGVPLSRWHAGHGFRSLRFPVELVGVRREREELDALIAARVRAMLRAGWVEEVRELLRLGYASARAMGAVGYKQIATGLESGALPAEEELWDSIRRATRVFARRQRTWLRDQGVTWLPPR